MSSPMDSAVDMKKRRRLQALASKANEKKEEKKEAGILGVADCDIGASPVMAKGSVFSKKTGGVGGKMSPIVRAEKFKLGRRDK